MPKITITPAQAILILIDNSQKTDDLSSKEKKKIEKLKRIYIGGVKSKSDKEYIFKLIKNESHLFANFDIKTDPKSITKDPSKRYFETTLAYHLQELLLDNPELGAITETYLDNVTNYIKTTKANFWELSEYRERIQDLIEGKKPEKLDDNNRYHTFNRLFQEAYEALTYAQDNKPLKKLLLSSYLPAFSTQLITELPLSIYAAGMFAARNRGLVKDYKVDTETKGALGNKTFGIFERSMPAPRTYISDMTFEMKPTGRAYFEESALWPQQNFKELTHPFVASISGTILAHLRMLLHQLQEKDIKFANTLELKNYLIRYISTLLYYAGGHSLREFTGVLEIPETRNEFSFYFKDFGKEINLLSLFKEQFQEIFNRSINDAIQYNKKIIHTNISHKDIEALGENREERSNFINKNKNIIDSEIINNFLPYLKEHMKESAAVISTTNDVESKLLVIIGLMKNYNTDEKRTDVDHHFNREKLRDLSEIINQSPTIKELFEKYNPALLEDHSLAVLQRKLLSSIKHSNQRSQFQDPNYSKQLHEMRKICFEELSKYQKGDFISKGLSQIYALFELNMTNAQEIQKDELQFVERMGALETIFLAKNYKRDADKIDQIKNTYQFLLSKNCPESILLETKNDILNTLHKMINKHKPFLINQDRFKNFKNECIDALSDAPILESRKLNLL